MRQTITAEEARRIAEERLCGAKVHVFVAKLSQCIFEFADEGKRSLNPWLCLSALGHPKFTKSQREAIRKHFVAEGFKWQDHHLEHEDHPGFRPCSTLSW